jgi:hypothetical protein
MDSPQVEDRIVDGIEWYSFQRSAYDADGNLEDFTDEECQCARCGSSCGFSDCDRCGGEGFVYGEDIASSYDYGWIDEDATYECAQCHGKRGWHFCLSGPEWCKTNPMPGREHIESTAMRAEDYD